LCVPGEEQPSYRSVTPGVKLIVLPANPTHDVRIPGRYPVGPARQLRIHRLRRAALPADTEELARFLIGKTVVRNLPGGRISGRIVETEAYIVGDAAAHAFIGMTRRNRSLFYKRGHAYVYFAYGSCYLLNVSSEVRGVGAGVLLRALEPLEGVGLMERHRGVTRLRDLARGPGRLAEALQVDLRQDGVDLCAPGDLWLGTAVRDPGTIGVSVRIGITRDAHRELRFYERGNPFVSGPRSLSP
jgi:DNA-3-methyladenine glycosylase